MSDDAAKLVEKAMEREEACHDLLIAMERTIACQKGHIASALALILDNKIADAKHELEVGRSHMEQCKRPLAHMKLRYIAAENWIRKHGVDILDAEAVESGVDAGVAVKDAADILAKFCGK